MANRATSGISSTDVRKQLLLQIFADALTTYPWAYFKQYPGMEKILLAVSWRETHYGFNKGSPVTEPGGGNSSYKFFNNDSIVKAAQARFLANGDATALNNLKQGYAAHGLMQVMGWHNILGETTSASPGYFQSGTYNPIASANGLLVQPGINIDDLYWGTGVPVETGLKRGAIAGMIVLENKFKIYFENSTSKGLLGNTKGNWNGSMRNAVGSYLGNGKDKYGTTPLAYVTQIFENAGSSGPVITENKNVAVAASTPNTAATRKVPAGC